MSLFKTVTLTISRKATGSYVNGRWVDGAETTFPATGSLQPATGNKAQALMEGKRIIGIMEFITESKLIATDPLTQSSGDIVVIDDIQWEVVHTEPWQNNIINHYCCTIIRKNEVPAGVS